MTLTTAAYRKSNRARIREQARTYRESNRERLREYNAAYYRSHRNTRPRRPSRRVPREPVPPSDRLVRSEEERLARLNVATLLMRAFVAADLDPCAAIIAYFRHALDEDRALEQEFAARTEARLAAGFPRLAVRGVAGR